jgi:phenylpropionate dioxygenase-like ring-hydroxylating dioxygenase large terminal subunit
VNEISRKNPLWEINGRPQVRKEEYLSKDFAELEDKNLWPSVWQVACHETEVAKVGDYVTYDIGDESVIVVRGEDEKLKAYHNVCPHRGRALADGTGSTKEFRCGYHGWRFDLDGNSVYVQDEEDWSGTICRTDLKLHEVQIDIWGGWVWINMDRKGEPLVTFLGAVAERMKCYDLHEYKIRWYKTFKLACNWKLVVEAFNEGYHVAATHSELLNYNEDYTECRPFGIHTCYWQSSVKAPNNPARIGRSRRRGGVTDADDFRKFLIMYTEDFDEALKAMVTAEQIEAAQEVLTELPATASQGEVMELWVRKRQELAKQKGVNWPEIDPSYVEQCWHVFPNTVFLPTVDGLLWYRSRPIKGDPDHCYYDVISLERAPVGETPEFSHEVYPDWRVAEPGRILSQDYENLERVQQGMKSSAYQESRLNPVQEICISNFHRALHQWMNLEP